MVEAGQAVDYRAYSHGAYLAAEARAQAAKLGLWSGQFEAAAEWLLERRGSCPPAAAHRSGGRCRKAV